MMALATHIPWGAAQLCLDCEAVSHHDSPCCPSCTSETVVPLQKLFGSYVNLDKPHVSEIIEPDKGESHVED